MEPYTLMSLLIMVSISTIVILLLAVRLQHISYKGSRRAYKD